MKYEVVTTCHHEGWQKYGRRMALTYSRQWQIDTPLVLYTDDFKPVGFPPVEARSLPDWLTQFKARHKSNPMRNGIGMMGKPYNMLYDAVRFSHKVAAVVDAYEKSQADVLIWIDADVVTHSPVTRDFLGRLLPEGVALSWLWRSHKYPETGFVMFNLKHEVMPRLMAAYKHLYTEDLLFELEHWTDSHALEAAVRRMNAPWFSLSGSFHNIGHPFVNSILGSVMDHLKGNRKVVGRSSRRDLRYRRDEAYWRGVR